VWERETSEGRSDRHRATPHVGRVQGPNLERAGKKSQDNDSADGQQLKGEVAGATIARVLILKTQKRKQQKGEEKKNRALGLSRTYAME